MTSIGWTVRKASDSALAVVSWAPVARTDLAPAIEDGRLYTADEMRAMRDEDAREISQRAIDTYVSALTAYWIKKAKTWGVITRILSLVDASNGAETRAELEAANGDLLKALDEEDTLIRVLREYNRDEPILDFHEEGLAWRRQTLQRLHKDVKLFLIAASVRRTAGQGPHVKLDVLRDEIYRYLTPEPMLTTGVSLADPRGRGGQESRLANEYIRREGRALAAKLNLREALGRKEHLLLGKRLFGSLDSKRNRSREEDAAYAKLVKCSHMEMGRRSWDNSKLREAVRNAMR